MIQAKNIFLLLLEFSTLQKTFHELSPRQYPTNVKKVGYNNEYPQKKNEINHICLQMPLKQRA